MADDTLGLTVGTFELLCLPGSRGLRPRAYAPEDVERPGGAAASAAVLRCADLVALPAPEHPTWLLHVSLLGRITVYRLTTGSIGEPAASDPVSALLDGHIGIPK